MAKCANSGGERPNFKVKLMCSYGGKIQPRPHDHQLTYVGGDTKILTVDRSVKFSDFAAKLNSLCNGNGGVCLKYQLPGEDLDALVSVIDDDDLEQMMVEYDRLHRNSTKPARLRLFLFPPNRAVKTGSDSPTNPDFLFGFDKEYLVNSGQTFEIPRNPGSGSPLNPGPDPREQVQGITGQGGGLSWTRDCHVVSGSFAAPLVYRVPAGGYSGVQHGMQTMVVHREQPVGTFEGQGAAGYNHGRTMRTLEGGK